MTQAIQRVNKPSGANLTLLQSAPGKMSIPELKELAALYVESGMFADLKNVAQAVVKIKAGEDLGFSPHVSLAGIHFFQGRAVIGANLLASLIKDSGKYEYKILKHDKTICSLEILQKVDGEWRVMGVPVTYSIEDAKDAGLTGKDVWKKFPQDMLFAAAIRQAARRYCSDILRGTPTLEYYGQEEAAIDAETNFSTPSEMDQSPNIIDAEPVTDDRSALDDRIAAACRSLNAAKDSVEWKKSTLTEYAQMLFDLPDLADTDSLNTSQLTTLAVDLEERLAEINATLGI